MLLLGASLSTTSFNTYRRPWQLFRQFCSDRLHIQGPIFPISTEQLALFIAFLAEQKFAASTVMYAMAFFAALRVGEITCRPTKPLGNVMFLNQIVFMKNRKGVVSAIKVTFRNYKHGDPAVPVAIFLYREKPVCPVLQCLHIKGLGVPLWK